MATITHASAATAATLFVVILKVVADARLPTVATLVMWPAFGFLLGFFLELAVRWWALAYILMCAIEIIALGWLQIHPFYGDLGWYGSFAAIGVVALVPAVCGVIFAAVGRKLLNRRQARLKPIPR